MSVFSRWGTIRSHTQILFLSKLHYQVGYYRPQIVSDNDLIEAIAEIIILKIYKKPHGQKCV